MTWVNMSTRAKVGQVLAPPLRPKLHRPVRVFLTRLGDVHFWLIQGLILTVTVVHYGLEASGEPTDISSVHHIPVTLYLIAVLYAGVHYGFEGGVLTALWVVTLTAPSIALWHRDSFMWIGETAQLMVSLTVGAVVAWRVELEMRHRRQAEAAGHRIALLHEVSAAVAQTLELDGVLGGALARVAEALESDHAWISLWDGPGETPTLLAEIGEPICLEEPGGSALWQHISRDVQATARPLFYRERSIAVPLAAEGKLLGALGVGCHLGRTYTTDELDLLAAMANHIAVALDNARLYADELRMREALREYASQVTRAHEDERKRIARELHDGVLQDLIGVTRELDSLVERADLRANGFRDQLAALRLVTQTVRRFSRDLRPSVLDDLGLIVALEWLASDLSTRSGIAASVRVHGQARRLNPEHELLVFRIAQEALRNVEKHAAASNATVDVTFADDGLLMQVSDNGRGFRVRRLQDGVYSGKLGLLGMQERAKLMGASCDVQSEAGKGTQVRISLPVA